VDASKKVAYQRFEAGGRERVDGEVIAEASVTLGVNGEPWLSFLCTPRDLEAFAVGFLFNEGLIASRDEIGSIEVCGAGDLIDVWLTRRVEKPAQWRRTSGCTGGMTADDTGGESDVAYRVDDGGLVLSPAAVTGLVAGLLGVQELYRAAGGVHTSALADGERIVVCVEDIGRHNTFDKIAGRCLLEGIAPARRVLITTGRVSSEMMQKAARFGAAMVISRTSPTSLAVELAERWGVTLIGYAGAGRFNVYSHARRVVGDGDGGRREP